MSDEDFMRRAIEQSAEAAQRGEYPYGAVIVIRGRVVLSAYNTTNSTKDLALHAEMTVLRSLLRDFRQQEIQEATLYVSCEPCAMCSGAIYWSGISRVVYGCSTELDAQISCMPFAVPCRSILSFDRGHPIDITGPFLQEEAANVLRAFWPQYLKKHSASFGLAV
jgi:tRNA(Arg) A34 adenosine deaminase TadA